MKRKRIAAVAGLVLTLVLVGAALAGSKSTSRQTGTSAVSGTITFDGIWTAGEAKSFGAVIAAFNKTYPKVHVNYKPVGNNVPTVLATAIAGGHPPDMADIAQPGLVKQYALQKKLKPIDYAKGSMGANFAPVWSDLATFNGHLY